MKCQTIRTSTEDINKVLAPNNNESTLYQDLVTKLDNKELALKYWSNSNSREIIDYLLMKNQNNLDTTKVKTLLDIVQNNNQFNTFFNTNKELLNNINILNSIDINNNNQIALEYLNKIQSTTSINDDLITNISNNKLEQYSLNDTLLPIQDILDNITMYHNKYNDITNSLSSNYKLPNTELDLMINNFNPLVLHNIASKYNPEYKQSYFDLVNDFLPPFDSEIEFINNITYPSTLEIKAEYVYDFNSKVNKTYNTNTLSNNIDNARKIAKDLLGNSVTVDTIIDTITNEGIVWGIFQNDIISLHNNAPEGTVYHEIFHKVFRTMLNNEEINHYLDEAKQQYQLNEDELNARILQLSNVYKDLTTNQLIDLVYEELMADDYRDFALNNQYPKGWLQSLFNLIKNFFLRLFKYRTEIDALFHSINNKGFLNKSNKSNKFLLSMPVYQLLFEDAFGKKQASESKTSLVVTTIASMLYSKLNNNEDNKQVDELFREVLAERTKFYSSNNEGDGHYAYIKSLEQNNQSAKVLETKEYLAKMRNMHGVKNKEMIWEAVKSLFNMFDYNPIKGEYNDIDNDSDVELSDNDNEVATNSEMLDTSNDEVNEFARSPKAFKQFVGFLSYPTKDEFTGVSTIEAVDGKLVHALLVKNLSSQDLMNEDILPKLKILSTVNEQLNAVYNALMSETQGDTEHPLISAFRSAINLEMLTPLEVIINPTNNAHLTMVASKITDTKSILAQWESNWNTANLSEYYDKLNANVTNDLSKSKDMFSMLNLEFNNQDYSKVNQSVERFLSGFTYEEKHRQTGNIIKTIEVPSIYEFTGMNLSSAYIKFSMLSNLNNVQLSNEDSQFLTDMSIAGMKPLTVDDLNQIAKMLYSSDEYLKELFSKDKEDDLVDLHNPYKYRTTGAYSTLNNIVQSNAILDDTDSNLSSYQDAAGNQRYLYVQKSYELTEIRKLRNKEYREAKKSNYNLINNYLLNLPNNIQDVVFGNSFKGLAIGAIRQDTVGKVNEFGIAGKIGNDDNTNKRDGVTTRDIDARSIEINKIALFSQIKEQRAIYLKEGKTFIDNNIIPMSIVDTKVFETKNQINGITLPSQIFNPNNGRFERAFKDNTITANAMNHLYNMLIEEINNIQYEGEYLANNYKGYLDFLNYFNNNEVLNSLGINNADELYKALRELEYKFVQNDLTDNETTVLRTLQNAKNDYESINFGDLYINYHIGKDNNGNFIAGRSTELWNFKDLMNIDNPEWNIVKNQIKDFKEYYTLKSELIAGSKDPMKQTRFDELDKQIKAFKFDSTDNKAAMQQALSTFMMNQINQYIKELTNYDLLSVDSNGNIEAGLSMPSIASTIYKLDEPNRMFNFIGDYLTTHFINVTAYNNIIDGNHNKAKDSFDRVKRNGGNAAYGANLGGGTFKVGYMEDSKLINSFGRTQKERGDAGAYMTFNRWKFAWQRLGKGGIKTLEPILNKIRFGEKISWRDKEELEHYNNILNSVKGVYFDGNAYHKLSYTILTRELTSMLPKDNKQLAKSLKARIIEAEKNGNTELARILENKLESLWIARPGREMLHNLRVTMMNQNLDEIIPLSASKLNTVMPAKEVNGVYDFTYSQMQGKNEYWRLQVEVPTGKQKITYFTQVLQLIDNEQDVNAFINVNGKNIKVSEVRNQYRNDLANRIRNSVQMALNELVDIDENGNPKKNNKKLINFYNKATETLLLSGGDNTLLDFFKTVGRENNLFNLNLPATKRKFEQLFLSHFSSGVLQQKVPGRKVSLVPDNGMNIITYKNNDNIVSISEQETNPDKYFDKEGKLLPEFTTRRLKWSQEQLHTDFTLQDEFGNEIYFDLDKSKLINNNVVTNDIAEMLEDSQVKYLNKMLTEQSSDNVAALIIKMLSNKLFPAIDVDNQLSIVDKMEYLFNLTDNNNATYSSKDTNEPILDIDMLKQYSQYGDYKLVTGNVKGRTFSEALMPAWTQYVYGLKKGQLIDENHEAYTEIMRMFGTRIPSQDKHSMIAFEVVDFLPVYMGDVGIFPAEITDLSGADFDIDSLYIIRKDFYIKEGIIRIYGKDRTDIGMWEDFVQYTKDYNKAVKREYKDTINPKNNSQLKELYNKIDIIKKEASKFNPIIKNLEQEVKLNEGLLNELQVQRTQLNDIRVEADTKVLMSSKFNDEQRAAYIEYQDILGSLEYKQMQDIVTRIENGEEDMQDAINEAELAKESMNNEQIEQLNLIMQDKIDYYNQQIIEQNEQLEQLVNIIGKHIGINTFDYDLLQSELKSKGNEFNRILGKKNVQQLITNVQALISNSKSLNNEINASKNTINNLKKELSNTRKLKITKLNEATPLNEEVEIIKNAAFYDAMKTNNLPNSLEQFINTPDYTNLNNSSINNRIVDENIALYQNSSVSDITTTPATMDKIQEDIVKALAWLHGTNVTNYVYNTLLGQMIGRRSGKIGKKLIGPGAIANIVKAALARNNVKLKANEFKLMFDNIMLDDFSNYYTNDVVFEGNDYKVVNNPESMRIMDEISALISAFTDSAKHNDPAKMNFTMSGINVWMWMVMLGYGLTRTTLVSKQNIIYDYDKLEMNRDTAVMHGDEEKASRQPSDKQLIKKYNELETAINTALMNKFNSLDDITKTEKLKNEISFGNNSFKFNPNGLNITNEFDGLNSTFLRESLLVSKELKSIGKDFNEQGFINELSKLTFDQLVKVLLAIKTQQSVLSNFTKMNTQARSINQLSKFLGLNKGLKASFFDNEVVDKAMQYFGLTVNNDTISISSNNKAPFNINQIINNEADIRELITSYDKIKSLSSQFFITQTKAFKGIFDTVVNNNKQMTNNAMSLGKIEENLMTYFTMTMYKKYLKDNNKDVPTSELLYDAFNTKTLQKQLRQAIKDTPSLANNYFIKTLRNSPKELKRDISLYNGNPTNLNISNGNKVKTNNLTFNTRVKNTTKINDKLMNAFMELMTYNEGLISMESFVPDSASTSTLIEQRKAFVKQRQESIKELANNMFNYLIVKDGLQYRNESFVKYIPSSMYEDISTLLNKLNEVANNDDWSSIQELTGITKQEFESNFINLYVRDVNNVDRMMNTTAYKLDMTNKDLFKEYNLSPISQDDSTITIDVEQFWAGKSTYKSLYNLAINSSDNNVLDLNTTDYNGVNAIDYLNNKYNEIKGSLIDKSYDTYLSNLNNISKKYKDLLLVTESKEMNNIVTKVMEGSGYVFKASGFELEFPRYFVVEVNSTNNVNPETNEMEYTPAQKYVYMLTSTNAKDNDTLIGSKATYTKVTPIYSAVDKYVFTPSEHKQQLLDLAFAMKDANLEQSIYDISFENTLLTEVGVEAPASSLKQVKRNVLVNTINEQEPNTIMQQELFNQNISTIINKIDFQEEPTTGYRQRTINNAKADATIAIAVDFTSAGEKLTKSSVIGQNKKYIPIDANILTVTKERVDRIVNELNSVNTKTLNIAGNGIYTMKGKYTQQQVDDFTYDLLNQVLNSPNLKTKIQSIRSGGQTGFDEAGAKAGMKLGLPTIVLAPKGWTFRDVNGKDISNEQQFKARFNNTLQVIDNTILQSPEYQSFKQNELSKSPNLTEDEILAYYKQCK